MSADFQGVPVAQREVKSIDGWKTNADLIYDVARLGYFDADDKGTPGTVLDATYGEGTFWNRWRPRMLVTNDKYKPADFAWDFHALQVPDGAYDAVVFDPPYKLNGTPQLGEQDARFGTDRRTTRDEVMHDIVGGSIECYRATRRWLLVKVMDQVEGGKMRWQTDWVRDALKPLGARKVDRFDFPGGSRPQPSGRRQRTARHTHSQLLVFQKPRRR